MYNYYTSAISVLSNYTIDSFRFVRILYQEIFEDLVGIM